MFNVAWRRHAFRRRSIASSPIGPSVYLKHGPHPSRDLCLTRMQTLRLIDANPRVSPIKPTFLRPHSRQKTSTFLDPQLGNLCITKPGNRTTRPHPSTSRLLEHTLKMPYNNTPIAPSQEVSGQVSLPRKSLSFPLSPLLFQLPFYILIPTYLTPRSRTRPKNHPRRPDPPTRLQKRRLRHRPRHRDVHPTPSHHNAQRRQSGAQTAAQHPVQGCRVCGGQDG